MRIRLKGLNSKRKRLADGSFKTYWWAWKGGPPLQGEPGTPEFMASYNAAVARKVTPPRGMLLSVLRQYQDSEDFRLLADSTRRSYIPLIARIEKAFGDFPLAALTDRRTRGVFMAWRDQIAANAGRRLGGSRPRAVVELEPWPHRHQPMRARRSAVSRRRSRRENLDRCGRGRVSQTCASAFAFGASARALDGPEARRPVAASVVGL